MKNRPCPRWTRALLSILILLTACESTPDRWSDSARARIEESLVEAAGGKPPPGEPVPQPPPEPRFDLSVYEMPARQVFLGLMEGTPYSVVLAPDVSGNVTLRLRGTTVPEALEAIRRAYGYDFRRDGQRFTILNRGIQTRIFQVNYLNFARQARTNTRVTTGELTQSASGGTGTAGAASGGATSSGSSNSVSVETTSQTDFWKELRETLTALIGSEGGRRVVVNPQSGVVIVRAMPDELYLVEEFLGMTHATLNRQVIIEAKIIEVELKDKYQAGINWSGLGSRGGVSVTGSQTGGGTILNSGVSDIAWATGSLFTPLANTAHSAFGGVFSLAVRATDFAAFLELLRSQGDIHVLSSPRVSTVNNQKAVIKVGGDEFFVTGVTNNSVTNAAGTVTSVIPTVELTPFFSGITLDVTPQIDEQGNINLHIHPSVSEVLQRSKNFVVAGSNFSLPLAVSTIQESDNVVRAASGQIIVIGGLMKEGATDEAAGIPIVGDIPVVGNAFKHKRVTRIKKELVILLKPTAIDGTPAWGENARESQERVRGIRRPVSEPGRAGE